MKKQKNSCILVISDLHAPYCHQDAIAFLEALNDAYSPDRIVCIGDEVDRHAMSFHDSDPDLPSAGDELKEAINTLQPLYELFPNVDLVHSNHGSLHYRKGRFHGIPMAMLKDYGDILQAPKGWKWHSELVITTSDGQDCLFTHEKGANIGNEASMHNMNVVQGHFHTRFDISYRANPYKLLWGMTVGCLIDDKSLAFMYNKTKSGTPRSKKPILGCGVIINGQPVLTPMVLDDTGRWVGEIY